jgi:mono/diheme cytochrome c family protein
MKSRIVVWIVLPALVVPLWCFAAAKGDAVKGKGVFGRCAICHGDAGEGKEAIGKAFGVSMKPLSSKEVQSLDDTDLKKGIIEGRGKMKPVSLSDAEIADVIAFLRTLKK